MAENDPLEDLVRFFCRHLVGLAGWYQVLDSDGNQLGEYRFFSYSGFVIAIQGTWNFVTAGHILEKLEKGIKSGNIKIRECMLVDKFGPDAASPYSIPFDYAHAPKMFINDDEAGLDFGLVILRQNYCDLLKANGIAPVLEKDWKSIPDEFADSYVMLGLPQQFIQTMAVNENGGTRMAGSVAPAAIGIKKLDAIPDNVKPTKLPRFIGKLADDGYLIEDIDGMSGGPILGFNKEMNRYWIIAIQSSWLKESRINFGCLVSIFANLVEEWINGFEP